MLMDSAAPVEVWGVRESGSGDGRLAVAVRLVADGRE